MINKAILMGRLTRDPELRHTNSGTAVCSFSIAIDNGYGDNKRTDFINCVAWSKTAEFVTNYFGKGKMIIVDGRIQSRSWDDPNGGGKRYATEVVAEHVSFGETKSSENGASEGYVSQDGYGQDSYAATPENEFDNAVDDDDLPF